MTRKAKEPTAGQTLRAGLRTGGLFFLIVGFGELNHHARPLEDAGWGHTVAYGVTMCALGGVLLLPSIWRVIKFIPALIRLAGED